MFIRVAAYANASRLLSADAALCGFQLAVRDNVQYLDGVWQALVDALSARARAFGVQVLRGALVSEVLHDGAVYGCTIRFIRRPPTSRHGMAR